MSRFLPISILIILIFHQNFIQFSRSIETLPEWLHFSTDAKRDLRRLSSQESGTKLIPLRRSLKSSLALTSFIHPCKTLETSIEIEQNELSSNGQLIRRCFGQAIVSKCEGGCVSNLRPSINTASGLLKVLSPVKVAIY